MHKSVPSHDYSLSEHLQGLGEKARQMGYVVYSTHKLWKLTDLSVYLVFRPKHHLFLFAFLPHSQWLCSGLGVRSDLFSNLHIDLPHKTEENVLKRNQ